MGSSSSSPLTATDVQRLLESDLGEDDPYWDELFSKVITFGSDNAITSRIGRLYSERRENYMNLLKKSLEKLNRSADILKSDPTSKETVFVIQTCAFVIHKSIYLMMQEDTKTDFLQEILKSFCQILFLRKFTLKNNTDLWCSGIKDDSKYDWSRLVVVETILTLYTAGYTCEVLPRSTLFVSTLNALRYYNRPALQRHIFNVGRRQKLIQKSILLCLLQEDPFMDQHFSSSEIEDVFSPLSDDFNRANIVSEIDTFLLPLFLLLVRQSMSSPSDSSISSFIHSNTISIIRASLHILDKHRQRQTAEAALYVLRYLMSFPSSWIALNVPCTFFDSDWPVHRGTHADILIEVASRTGLLREELLEQAGLVISSVIPLASHMSYISAVSIIKVLSKALDMKKKNVVQSLIAAIHYCINRSVRENAPLVIIMMKNLSVFVSVLKSYPEITACKQIIQFHKSINQELKQLGTRFKSMELEAFFSDPSCEHFASPVLKIPQPESMETYEFYHMIPVLAADPADIPPVQAPNTTPDHASTN